MGAGERAAGVTIVSQAQQVLPMVSGILGQPVVSRSGPETSSKPVAVDAGEHGIHSHGTP